MVEFQHNNYVYVSTKQWPFLLDTNHFPQIGFEAHHQGSKIESITRFIKQMKTTLEEVKLVIYKLQKDTTFYYN